ncbi:MAG: hypothetical protein LBC03_03540 [Nitrososphaerota archaeon]|jgi:uncharacterized membrane protein SpoIIM required for sporulation|nr:hypothetical protein [Nitrososphaerota archaeon]
MTDKSKVKIYSSRKTVCVILFFVVLFTSLIYILTINVENHSIDEDKSPQETIVYVETEEELKTAINNTLPDKPTIITLYKDITLTGTLAISANRTITLTSNMDMGFYKLIGTIDQDSTISISDGGVLRLDGIIVTHTNDVRGRGVDVGVYGTLIMVDGEISGNKISSDGGGIYNSGNFKMLGGTISGNTVSSYSTSSGRGFSSSSYGGRGGGVYNRGSFEMSGGTISGNTASSQGGGVYNFDTFKMTDGLIYGNKASSGGDVYNAAGGTVDKSGGLTFGNIDLSIVLVMGVIVGVISVLFLHFMKEKTQNKTLGS